MKTRLIFFLSFYLFHASAQNSRSVNLGVTNAHVEIPRSSALNLGTGNFTLAAWIKAATTQASSYPQILSGRATTGDGFLLGLFDTGGNVYMQLNGVHITASTSADLRDNTWHYVAVTRNNNLITYYVDGQSHGTGTSSGDINAFHDIWVGLDEPNMNDTWFNGLIDEVSIWNIPLSGVEIQSAMNTCLTGNEPGLAGYWTFNESSGVVTPDLTSNGNNGTLAGSAARSVDVPFTCAVGVAASPLRETWIKVYPNPADNLLTVENPDYLLPADYTLKIMNSQGQELFSYPFNVQMITVDMNQLGGGLYMMQLLNGHNEMVADKKIMVF